MEIRQLTYFLAAVETQNFRKAAELCYVAQSALSRQIAALEQELGVELFERKNKRIFLTPAGHEFAAYARQALEQLQQGQLSMARLQGEFSGTLRIACIEPLLSTLLYSLATHFHQQYPHIYLDVRVALTDEILTLVEQGEIDVGFLFDPLVRPELLVVQELFREPLQLLVPAQHPLTRVPAEEITIERIVSEPLLLLRSTFRLRRIIDRVLLQRGIAVQPIIEIDAVEGLKQLVRHGVGISLVTAAFVPVEQRDDGLAILPIVDVVEEFLFAITYRRVGPLPAVARRFVEMVLDSKLRLQGN
ncbi:LysR family transcriptional regulator [Thermosporothrix hazakensis]|nr:LysR family transcriptional regulator [Thermosporothrix hazakensis]BBH91166.1 LysR family transcriptional regulator [Thermosporothrix sp. COM3]GCE49311.1 LysR family transcriptional regulator [Thermosporothrix hazakensis]